MINIEWKFPKLDEKLRRNLDKIYLTIAASMQTNRAELFYSEGSNNGHKFWSRLKFRDGMILQKSGKLRKSISPTPANGHAGSNGIVRISPDHVTIGTNLYYASMMNFGTTKMPGGVLKPVRAKALKIPNPSGGFLFRKSVRIPERRFDEWTDQDQAEMEFTLVNTINAVLKAAS